MKKYALIIALLIFNHAVRAQTKWLINGDSVTIHSNPWDQGPDNCNLLCHYDTLLLTPNDSWIRFIKIDGMVYEIKRTITLEKIEPATIHKLSWGDKGN
jgi:hypothetical protein